MNIFTRFFTKYFTNPSTPDEIERDLIRRESEIGRTVFGPVPKGVKREFFCLDKATWIWHEEKSGKKTITRYKIKKTEIIKSVNDGHYERVSLEEAKRFTQAVKLYNERVNSQLYSGYALA
jgi:hypothetical protein